MYNFHINTTLNLIDNKIIWLNWSIIIYISMIILLFLKNRRCIT